MDSSNRHHLALGGKRPTGATPDVHLSGVITVVLEVFLLLENLLPLVVALWWKRPIERVVTDKLIAAISVTYILSALIPTPLGLVSFFNGSWYGGKATCECFQVTTTWCSLSTMAFVTYMCVERHNFLCPCFGWRSSVDSKDSVGLMLFLLYTITLSIATLPVIGFGPEVMKGNNSCESWIVSSPVSGKRQVYFIAFLTFGYINVVVTAISCTFIGIVVNRPKLAQKLGSQDPPIRNTEFQLLDDQTRNFNGSHTRTVLILVVLNQITWIPALTMITIQKCDYKVSEAAMMYALLATSLPGLLNPLLYGLFLESYREGYKKLLLRFVCCCLKKTALGQELQAVTPRIKASTSAAKRVRRHHEDSFSTSASNPICDNDSLILEIHQNEDNTTPKLQIRTIEHQGPLADDDDASCDTRNKDPTQPTSSDLALSSSCSSSEEYLLDSDDDDFDEDESVI
ncbi:melatonin receptor type 1A [Patella vulgata]|uniref:melatonin receptor type 1A n=1 Tax=Patella vulgata TaxID=6465 RepID=UPI00217F7315|nr:melatonin receptor type 1A [Patella vulgata]XP_050418544.1 melatonin receptor type 1A [Patella vulgata]